MNSRRLKIEPHDEQCGRRLTKALIRLKGRWLREAGFQPGQHLEVVCIAPGRLVLQTTPMTP
jgi:hypothetical protein